MESLTDAELKATLEEAERWERRRMAATSLSDLGYFRTFYPQLIVAMSREMMASRERIDRLEKVVGAASAVKEYADGVGECAVCDRIVEDCDRNREADDFGCFGADIRYALAALEKS